MSNYELEEAKLVEIQMALSFLSLVVILLSIYLSYNSLMGFLHKDKIFTNERADRILKFNRSLALIIGIGFLLINYYDRQLKDKYNRDIKEANIQIGASILVVIARLMVFYIAFSGISIISEENPTE